MKRQLKAVSLFTGAGGLDLGFEAAGFETRVAVEMDAQCVKTLRHNRSWPVIHGDIHSVTSEAILEAGNLKRREADVLIGGPPCQPFSKSGFWATGEAKRLADPRASTLDEYLRILEEILPKAFVIENVAGLGYKGKSEGLEYIKARISEINASQKTAYEIDQMTVNTASYGVPQVRERMLLVAHREGKKIGVLEPTHTWGSQVSEPSDMFDALLPPLTAWDAIGHLSPQDGEQLQVRGKWADLLPTIPEGQNYLFHTDRGEGEALFGWRRRFWNFLLKLSRDKPSWTITAQPGPATGPFHWENRHLSARELCALQTFPSDFEVLGTRAEVQKQVGNAVPSALGELLGLRIRARYFGESEFEDRPLSLIPVRKKPSRKKDVPAPLPECYRELVGEHSAHPGTGRGFGAEKIKEAMHAS